MNLFIKKYKIWLLGIAAAVVLLLVFILWPQQRIENFSQIDRLPVIDPDYRDLLIPPNIAPLNFMIMEKGEKFQVEIYSGDDRQRLIIPAQEKKVQIPLREWKNLLAANQGGKLFVDVLVCGANGRWNKYRTIENTISRDKIDSHVAYRLINPGYVLWWDMGIYQRNIENFDQSPIFTNRMTKRNCMNCHSFCLNNPDLMMFHMRAQNSGTIIVRNGQISKVNTGTPYTMSPGVYPAWHPDGKHIAFSVNKIDQSFHAQQGKSIYVRDTASDLIIYNIETNIVTTSPKVSTKRLENAPAWSPDGKLLYFCSGNELDRKKPYTDTRYDLLRIPYDTESGQWGDRDTVLTAAETGKSISFPKISPDGRFLLCCMSDYGYFTIHFTSSDLYLLDLATGRYWKPEINSAQSEGYHSWSSNSRWIVFASKRADGMCSRLYFSHVDSLGQTGKPFVLPQEDPAFYASFIRNYNVPELIKGPVKTDYQGIASRAVSTPLNAEFDKAVNVDALSGATRIVKKK